MREGALGKPALRRLFAIDLRSLAAFRIAMGLVLLVDLGIRAADIDAMYTDDGMFSRTTIGRHYSVWNWSFHFGGGSWAYQAGLFGFAAVFALALLVGHRTRLAAVASWLMLVSLHNRVPHILSGADNLARLLLFWGMFLPLDRVWSLDAWSAKRRGLPRAEVEPVLSVASAAILLQMAFLYLFSAVFKSNADWFHGKALAAILSDGFYGSPLGVWFLEFPRALEVLTVSILLMEWIGPFLLFSPIRTGCLRSWVLGFLALLHAGVAILLNVGLFSVVALAGLLPFLPSSFWDKLTGLAGGAAGDPERPGTIGGLSTTVAGRRASLAAQAACALALAYVVFANINELPPRLVPWTPIPRTELLTVSFGLGQQWDMFAEAPSRNGWYVARATLVDGTGVDLLRQGGPVVWERPHDPAAIYPNHRWRKCFLMISYGGETGYDVFRQPVAEYLCRDWNRRRPSGQQVSDFALVFCMEDRTAHDLGPAPSTLRVTVAHLDFRAPEGVR